MKIAVVGLALALISFSAHAADKIRVIVANVSQAELAGVFADHLRDKVRNASKLELSSEANNAKLAIQIAAYQTGETAVALSISFDVEDPWTERWLSGSQTPYVCTFDKLPDCAQAIFDAFARDAERMIQYRERLKEIRPRTEPLP